MDERFQKSKSVLESALAKGMISQPKFQEKMQLLEVAATKRAELEAHAVDELTEKIGFLSIQSKTVDGLLLDGDTLSRVPPMRDYQQDIVQKLLLRFGTSKRETKSDTATLVYLPTGGGKTRIAAELSASLLRRGQSTLFVVNRVQLLGQTEQAFLSLGIPRGSIRLISSGYKDTSAEPRAGPVVTIASIQTMARRFEAALSRWVPSVVSSAAKTDSESNSTAGDKVKSRTGSIARSAVKSASSRRAASLPLRKPKAPTEVASAGVSSDASPVEQTCDRSLSGDGDPSEVGGSKGPSGAGADRELPPHDCVIVDEAHGVVAKTPLALTDLYRGLGAMVVGLTATPTRLREDESLALVFDEVLQGPSVGALVDRGVLVPPVVVQIRQRLFREHEAVVRANVKARARRRAGAGGTQAALGRGGANAAAQGLADPGAVSGSSEQVLEADGGSEQSTVVEAGVEEEVALGLRRSPPVTEAVQAWQKHAFGRRTVAFAQSVKHSRALVAGFEAYGIRAVHVDGKTAKAVRDQAIDALARGDVLVVSSVGVLSEGFDEPKVACVMLLRPTQSKALYVQQVGRGLRQAEGKRDCVVIDQAGNTARHGPVTKSLLKPGEIGKWKVHRVQTTGGPAAGSQVAAAGGGGGCALSPEESRGDSGTGTSDDTKVERPSDHQVQAPTAASSGSGRQVGGALGAAGAVFSGSRPSATGLIVPGGDGSGVVVSGSRLDSAVTRLETRGRVKELEHKETGGESTQEPPEPPAAGFISPAGATGAAATASGGGSDAPAAAALAGAKSPPAMIRRKMKPAAAAATCVTAAAGFPVPAAGGAVDGGADPSEELGGEVRASETQAGARGRGRGRGQGGASKRGRDGGRRKPGGRGRAKGSRGARGRGVQHQGGRGRGGKEGQRRGRERGCGSGKGGDAKAHNSAGLGSGRGRGSQHRGGGRKALKREAPSAGARGGGGEGRAAAGVADPGAGL